MATFRPAYRLTVYAPRDVDPTEATILTPRGGASHGDAFKVITMTGVAGWKPYMYFPEGRRGRIDVLEKRTDIGALSIKLLDKRVAGSDNAKRWFTAFIGDALGNNALLGCKVLIEESTNAGGAWAPFFTGRIDDTETDLISGTLRLKELSDDLNVDIFVTRPHSSITYAHRASLLPVGLVGSYGGMTTVRKFRGPRISLSGEPALDPAVGYEAQGNFITETLLNLSYAKRWGKGIGNALRGEGDLAYDGTVRVWVKQLDGGAAGTIGELELVRMTMVRDVDFNQRANRFLVKELPATDANYVAMPALNVNCDFYLFPTAPVDEDSPILIDDVHVAQLVADLIDGKFGFLLTDPALGSPGAVMTAVPRDKAAGWTSGDPWSPIINDTTIPKVRFPIFAKGKRLDWIEKHLLKPYHLALRPAPSGGLVLVDLRRKSTTTAPATITDLDLIGRSPPKWRQRREDAITRIDAKYYVDDRIPLVDAQTAYGHPYPSVPTSLIRSVDVALMDLNFGPRALAVGTKVYEIEFLGLRGGPNDLSGLPQPPGVIFVPDKKVEELLRELEGPFGTGPAYLSLTARRTANTACLPGEWRYANVTAQPNPALAERGGTRLMLCVDRIERGLAVDLEFLDAGPNSVAVAPAISAWAVDGTDPKHAANATFTLNASSQPIALHILVTDTSVGVRPADDDARWRLLGTATAAATTLFAGLPAGRRIWLRGRTQARADSADFLPSAWIYPSGTGYVDTTAESSVTGAAVSNIAKGTADLAWTNGDATLPVEVCVSLGASVSEADSVILLPPGTKKYRLRGLDGPSTQHTAGVRHRGPSGGIGAFSSATFTTGTTNAVAPTPYGIAVVVPT